MVVELQIQELQTSNSETSEQLTKKIAKGGGIAFAANTADKGVRFLLQILLARVLGASSYGLYLLGYSLTMIASQVSVLGLATGTVRFAALYKGVGDIKRVKGTLISTFAISTLASVVAGILLFLFSGRISQIFNMPQLSGVLRVFAFALPFYVFMIMAGYSARAFQAIKYEAAVRNVFHPIANIVFVSIFLLLGFRLLGVIYGFLISSAISAFFGLYLLTQIFPEIVSELKPSYEFKKLLRFSLPVFVVGFSYSILLETDKIMLGYFKASEDLGIYAAAANISQQGALIVYSFSCIFGPIVSDLHNRREFTELENLYKTLTRWVLSLSLPILIVMILFSKQIMGIFGPEFVSGWSVLLVLSCGRLIIYCMGSVLAGYMLPMSGKQDIEMVNTFVMAVLNIALNFWLIQIYGILGAAIATGISIAITDIMKITEVRILLGMQPYSRSYHKPFVACLAALLVTVLLPIIRISSFHWILRLAIFFVVYFLILRCLGLEDEDVRVLRAVRKRLNSTLKLSN